MNRAILVLVGLLFSVPLAVQSSQEPISPAPTTSPKPVAIGLLIDNSGSLRASFSQVIDVGKDIVHNATTADQIFVVRFVTSGNITIPCDFTTKQAPLNAALDDMYIEGGLSAITDAVYVAAEHFPNPDDQSGQARRQAIVLITDGGEESSYYRTDQLFDLLRKKQLRVYAVGFPQVLARQGAKVEERARKYLTTLAAESGGRVYFPATADEAKTIAKSVLTDIRGH